jgi:hypothetical protein
MKECRICGMPLENKTDTEICDFCSNDDGIEILADDEDTNEF